MNELVFETTAPNVVIVCVELMEKVAILWTEKRKTQEQSDVRY